MSIDFVASIAPAALNTAGNQLFPALGPKIGGTSTIPSPKAAVTWGLASPPEFQFPQAQSAAFSVALEIALTVTPDGGKPATEKIAATATAGVAISAGGQLTMAASGLSFATSDPFVGAVLAAKKAEILGQINALLSKIEIPVGPFEGVTMAGYAAGFAKGFLFVEAGMAAPVALSIPADPGSVEVRLSQPLVQQLVKTAWWDKADKSFGAGPAQLTLDSYKVILATGGVVLELQMSGNLYVGPAHWVIQIDPIFATFYLQPRGPCGLYLANAQITPVNVLIKPDNAAAWAATFALAPVYIAIRSFMEGRLGEAITEALRGPIYEPPLLKETFEGVPITVQPEVMRAGVEDGVLAVDLQVDARAG